jgi:hypothetical protein
MFLAAEELEMLARDTGHWDIETLELQPITGMAMRIGEPFPTFPDPTSARVEAEAKDLDHHGSCASGKAFVLVLNRKVGALY